MLSVTKLPRLLPDSSGFSGGGCLKRGGSFKMSAFLTVISALTVLFAGVTENLGSEYARFAEDEF